MEAAFLRVITLSATCSLVIFPLLLLSRRLSHRYAAKTMSGVWMVLAARLLYFPKEMSIPAAVTVEAPAATVALPAAIPLLPQNAVAGELGTAAAARPALSVSLTALLAALWLAGIAVTLAVQLVSYLLARRALLRGSVPVGEAEFALLERLCGELAVFRRVGLRRSANARTPMAVGALRTAIVLPEEPVDARTLEMILRHELWHIRRYDLYYKLVMLFTAAVHWFNPLVWWMGREAGRDLELCCDDAVLFGAGNEKRREYGEVLLQSAAEGRFPAISTHFGSEKRQMKARLANLFQKKRNSMVLVCAMFVCAILLGSSVAYERAPKVKLTPAEALNALEESVSFDWDMENVSFVLPADYAPATDWNITVAGRNAAFDGMSLHYFEGETWKPGSSYLINLTGEQRGDITSLDMEVTLPDPSAAGGVLERTIDLRAWLSGAEQLVEPTPSEIVHSERVHPMVEPEPTLKPEPTAAPTPRPEASHSPEPTPAPAVSETPAEDLEMVIYLDSGSSRQLVKSGSFEAEEGQVLTLTIGTGLTDGTADFFLFDPEGEEEHISIGSEPILKKITLSEGTWAYNCTGFWSEDASIQIFGYIKK